MRISDWSSDVCSSDLSGKLVDILTNPKSVQIGRHALKTYHVEEVQGVVFVYVGDGEPHALLEDVPPGFLDADRAIEGPHRLVAANWRMGEIGRASCRERVGQCG